MPLDEADLKILQQCAALRTGSYDPDRQVGVIITSSAGDILATGTNRPPTPLTIELDEARRLMLRDPLWKYFVLEHAERNAISMARSAGRSLQDATLYSTLFPCADCARALVSAGIKRLVAPAPDPENPRDQRWLNHYKYAKDILDFANVRIDTAPSDF